MKKHSMYAIFLFAVVALSYGFLSREPGEVNDISVLVKYKSQPGKEMIAVTELKSLVGKVKQEPHYGNITIYSDPADPTNILLYEHWKNEEYYKGDHMKTSHLQTFINNSRNFLAGPPEITFWKVVE